MRVTFKFDLPEEASEYKIHSKASDYYLAISDIAEYLRSQIKYQELPPAKREVFEDVREKFYELLRDREVAGDF